MLCVIGVRNPGLPAKGGGIRGGESDVRIGLKHPSIVRAVGNRLHLRLRDAGKRRGGSEGTHRVNSSCP